MSKPTECTLHALWIFQSWIVTKGITVLWDFDVGNDKSDSSL